MRLSVALLLILFSVTPAFAQSSWQQKQCGKGEMPTPNGCMRVCPPGDYVIEKDDSGYQTCLREGIPQSEKPIRVGAPSSEPLSLLPREATMKLATTLTLCALLVVPAAISDAKLKNAVYVCESKGAVQVDDEGKLGPPIMVDEVKFNFEPASGTYEEYATGEHPEKYQVLPRGKDANAPIVAMQRGDDGGLDLLVIDWAGKQATFALYSVGGAFFGGTCEQK